MPRLHHNPMARVNDEMSCAVYCECATVRNENGTFCHMHMERIRDLVQSNEYTTACLVKVPLAEVQFTMPSKISDARFVWGRYWLLARRDFSLVWSTDSEGFASTRKGHAALPSEFGIISLQDADKKHDEHIRYARYSTRASIVRDLRASQAIRTRSGGAWSPRVAIWVHEMSGRQSEHGYGGLTFSEHRDVLLDTLGFDVETAAVVKWVIPN